MAHGDDIQRRKAELNILLRELVNLIYLMNKHAIYVLLYTIKKNEQSIKFCVLCKFHFILTII